MIWLLHSYFYLPHPGPRPPPYRARTYWSPERGGSRPRSTVRTWIVSCFSCDGPRRTVSRAIGSDAGSSSTAESRSSTLRTGVSPTADVRARAAEQHQIDEWGEVEAGHDLDAADLAVRVSAASVFMRLLKQLPPVP